MTLVQLRHLISLAQSGSFTKSAESLFLTQPALSRQMQALENEIGGRLLERESSGSYHYPAVIQAKDDRIHVVYSYFVKGGKSMKHAAFTEEWIKQGDK